MNPSAYFINVGRGKSVVTDDLLAALKTGRIAGAGLDVVDPEPLPKDHPLWHARNVVITPHVAGSSELKLERAWGGDARKPAPLRGGRQAFLGCRRQTRILRSLFDGLFYRRRHAATASLPRKLGRAGLRTACRR
jgi:hypothetical protein